MICGQLFICYAYKGHLPIYKVLKDGSNSLTTNQRTSQIEYMSAAEGISFQTLTEILPFVQRCYPSITDPHRGDILTLSVQLIGVSY